MKTLEEYKRELEEASKQCETAYQVWREASDKADPLNAAWLKKAERKHKLQAIIEEMEGQQ